MMKVFLIDSPASELFERRAQDVMKRLDSEWSPSGEASIRHSPYPYPDKHEGERRGNGPKRMKEVGAQTRGRKIPNPVPAAKEEDPRKGEPAHPAVTDPPPF
jgi:hypothetical protein